MRDGGWIRQILRGDRAAGEEFVSRNYETVFRFLRHLTGSREAAEDLTQQTFLNAWRALPAFRGGSSLRTWLHRIAYHEYTHWLRSRREHAPLDAAANMADANAPEEWETLVLSTALAQLSVEHRETFLLFYVQQLSAREVAAVLEVPTGTVKSRLFVARRQLRELLVNTPEQPAPRPAILPASAPSVKEVLSHEMPLSQSERPAC